MAALKKFDARIGALRKNLDSISSSAFGMGRQFTAVGAVATGVFGLAVKQAIEWESDFTGVRKTVNATEEEFAYLEQRLREMAKQEIPLPVGDLARLAEVAGQQGIAVDRLDEFVEVIAKLGTTTNIVGEEGAQSLARFANVTRNIGKGL